MKKLGDSPAIAPIHLRKVQSFVRRKGRLTDAQERALAHTLPRFGVDLADGTPDWDQIFGRRAPRIVEIGFGNGETLLAAAADHPEIDFLGIEVYESGVGRVLQAIEAQGISNIRLICDDAVAVLTKHIAPQSLLRINIYFPDPWHKKRHHKRRLINPAFVQLATSRLAINGLLHAATDWQNYAEQILEVLNAEPLLENQANDDGYLPRPDERPLTRFERRGHARGHEVWDVLFKRRSND